MSLLFYHFTFEWKEYVWEILTISTSYIFSDETVSPIKLLLLFYNVIHLKNCAVNDGGILDWDNSDFKLA